MKTWCLDNFCWASPTTLVFGGGLPVEVDQVPLLQLELLIRHSGLGSQRTFQPELGCFLNHGSDGNLSHPKVMARVPRDSARRIIQLRLASGLELRESRRVPAIQSPIGRMASNLQEAVLGEETLGQDHVQTDVNALFCELSFNSQQNPS